MVADTACLVVVRSILGVVHTGFDMGFHIDRSLEVARIDPVAAHHSTGLLDLHRSVVREEVTWDNLEVDLMAHCICFGLPLLL